jgi:hypothetical protein
MEVRQLRAGAREIAASLGRKRPRQKLDDVQLARVADVYLKSFEQGDPDPGRVVAKSFGRPQSTTDKWIARARKKYPELPKTRRGGNEEIRRNQRG